VYVGITGHRSLPDETMWAWTAREIDAVLAEQTATGAAALVGVTGLAAGADSVFADVVLDRDGALHVVLAFAGFERSLGTSAERAHYAELLGRAVTVETLERVGSDEDAYLAEGRRVVALSELLLAVWDGEPARGVGGTGDVVDHALRTGTPVVHLDPFRRSVDHLGVG
jgi:hypothetical protein